MHFGYAHRVRDSLDTFCRHTGPPSQPPLPSSPLALQAANQAANLASLQNKINQVNTTVNRLNTNVNILNTFKNATQPLTNIRPSLTPLPAGEWHCCMLASPGTSTACATCLVLSLNCAAYPWQLSSPAQTFMYPERSHLSAFDYSLMPPPIVFLRSACHLSNCSPPPNVQP